MRGFVFSLDMALAAVGVLLLLSILIQGVDFPTPSGQTMGRIVAKDATLAWLYTNTPSALPTPAPSQYACDTGFRPQISTAPLNPNVSTDWVIQENCVVIP